MRAPSPVPSASKLIKAAFASFIPDQPERRCVMCGGHARNRHFGVVACEACAVFYRRSVAAPTSPYCKCPRRQVNRCRTSRITENEEDDTADHLAVCLFIIIPIITAFLAVVTFLNRT
ncbi:nuclear receptor subfamily 6 group A member 1-A [Aphelenchoides avenae]|nr:nuclear receptor subfamily 6 group A member 1-A [Aphelenchus avenae]